MNYRTHGHILKKNTISSLSCLVILVLGGYNYLMFSTESIMKVRRMLSLSENKDNHIVSLILLFTTFDSIYHKNNPFVSPIMSASYKYTQHLIITAKLFSKTVYIRTQIVLILIIFFPPCSSQHLPFQLTLATHA